MEQLGRLMMVYDTYGQHLTARQRQAFGLRYAADLSLAEVAAELSTTRPAAAYLLRRARQTLERLEQEIGAVAEAEEHRQLLVTLDRLVNGNSEDLGRARELIRARLKTGGERAAGVTD